MVAAVIALGPVPRARAGPPAPPSDSVKVVAPGPGRRAEPAPVGVEEGLRDSSRAPERGVPADSVRIRERGYFDAPGWVMARSLALPGWGQFHNGAWLKGVLLGGAETALALGVWDDSRGLPRLQREADEARQEGDLAAENAAITAYNDRLARLNSRAWMLGAVVFYTLMDAYVDAHFRDFEIEFETDPALPGGKPPERGTRFFLRWHF